MLARPSPAGRGFRLVLTGLVGLVLAGLTGPAPAAEFPGRDKIIGSGLLAGLEAGRPGLRVIVLLQGYKELEGLKLDRPGEAKALRAAVARAQKEVIGRLGPEKIRLRFRFQNILGFAAAVDPDGLKALAALDQVVVIEEDRRHVFHTAQGVPQMSPGRFRSAYGGRNVAVALVDSGVDYNHPALGGGGFPNDKVIGGYDFGDRDADPMDNSLSRDAVGHGTATASIAAGLNTSTGDYAGGVAPEAKIYSLKVADSLGVVSSSNVIAAWDWCLSHRNDDPQNPIKVVSNSLGSVAYPVFCDALSPAYATAARNLVANGVAIMASSGNEGQCSSVSVPACLSNTISVGAVYDSSAVSFRACIGAGSCIGSFNPACPSQRQCADNSPRRDGVACYSNSAAILDLLAPANCACTAWKDLGYYRCFAGTSASSPYAAGAAALIQSWAKAARGDYLTVEELKARLTGSGDPVLDTKSGLTRPRINIARAISNSPSGASGLDQGAGCATAQAVAPDATLRAAIDLAGDNDYFRIHLPSDRLLSVRTSGSTNTFGSLLNAACGLIASDDNSGAGQNFSLSRQLSAGHYYIRVRHASPAGTGAYTLILGDGGAPCFAAAVPVSLNAAAAGNIAAPGQSNYYQIHLASTTQLNIFTSGLTDTFGYLYSPDCDLLAQNDNAGPSQNFQISRSVPAGTYYLRVRHRSASGTGRYSLYVLGSGGADSCEGARAIILGQSYPDTISRPGQNNYYRLEVPLSGNLTVFTTGGSDTYGYLLNSACQTITSNDDTLSDLNFRIERYVTAGTYYLRVRLWSSFGTGAYVLSTSLR